MDIGEAWKFPKPALPEISAAAQGGVPDALVLTPEAGEVLSVILEQFAGGGNPPRGALLLSGDLGIDRTYFLRFVRNLLADPAYPFWSSLLDSLGLGEAMRPGSAIRSQFIQIPRDSSIDLSGFLLETLRREMAQVHIPPRQDKADSESFPDQIMSVSGALAEKSVGMIVLENISDRIDALNDAEKHQTELRLYRMVSKACSRNGILTVLIGREEHLVPEDATDSAEASAHNYCWIELDESADNSPRTPSGQEKEFREKLQLLIYNWIQAEIPSWKPERSPNYLYGSQALTASIPEGEQKPQGLVYFKSVYDPCWSDEDLDRLQRTAPSWILIVLNPYERFYEVEPRLREIALRVPMLMIWRPDAPSRRENEILHSLALEVPVEILVAETVAGESVIPKVRAILSSLYVSRGQLIETGRQHTIADEKSGRSICRYISDCLIQLHSRDKEPVAKQDSTTAKPGDEYQGRHWAALLTGNGSIRYGSIESAQEQLMAWLEQSADIVTKNAAAFPEAFRTTRFSSGIKAIESPLRVLKAVLYSLRSGAFSFSEGIDHIGRCFGWDERRLLKWKQGLENLAGLAHWLPAFRHAHEYLSAAYELGRGSLDSMRESLLRSIDEPHRFLEPAIRNDFDERFLDFKKSYTDTYFLLHEDALHVMSGLKKDELRIDPIALRNLDLLSGLQYTDKSYLNRVKLLAKWIQRNQCNLPLHQILDLYPRCYCNFNPCSRQHPAGAAVQINSTIQEGLQYFRTILRRCGTLIMMEVKSQPVDDNILKQITAALSDGPMIPLKPQAIKVLNRVIVKNSSEFLVEIRRASVKTAAG